MLEIDDLSVSYGGLAALSGVTLSVAEGQFVAIVGPNGAGKTTLFKAISGTVPPAVRCDHVRGPRPARGAPLGASTSRHLPRAGRTAGVCHA